jgi:acetoin utilization protein AcuB
VPTGAGDEGIGLAPSGGKLKEEPMATSVTAQEIMTRHPVTVPPQATIGQVMGVLQELDVRHVPVVQGQRELVGIVSDRDLRGLPLPDLVGGKAELHLDTPISRVMSGDPITIDPETELPEIIDLFIDHKIGALPVVDPEGNLVGIVSYVDVLRAVAQQLE